MDKCKAPPNSFKDCSLNKKSSCCYIKKVPPDGGWGWMVVLGSFLGMILGTFPPFSFSILFSPILMSHSVSSTKTAWIYNVHGMIWSSITLFIGPVCDAYGWKKVALFAGIANSISVFLSAFAPKPDYLFFSYSILGGVGGSTALSLSYFVVSRYFKKRLGFALAITTLGGCVSSFLAPIVANYLLEHFGFRGASLIMAAIVLNQCVGGSLYQPVEWHMKTEVKNITEEEVNKELLKDCKTTNDSDNIQKKTHEGTQRKGSIVSTTSVHSVGHSLINVSSQPTSVEESESNNETKHKSIPSKNIFISVLKSALNNLKSLKYLRVNLIAWGYCGLILGYANFQMWIPFVITNAGHSLEMAAWCSSSASIGNVIGRILMAFLSDRKFFNIRYGYMFGLFLIASSIIGFSLVNDITYYIVFTCGWGLGVGIALALNVTVMIDVMGVEMLPAVLGISSLSSGFGGITIGTLAGVIRDATSNYTYALWILGGCEAIALFMWLLMPCGERFDERKYPNEKKEPQNY